MSDQILYNFGSNFNSLDDITRNFGDLQRVHDDITTIRSAIVAVYGGDGATALAAKCDQISAMLDTAISDANSTTKFANEQQEFMRGLDNHNAAQF